MIYNDLSSIHVLNNDYLAAPSAYKKGQGMLYHYTSAASMWKILESDQMYARNTRFSNDASELLAGREIGKEYIKLRRKPKGKKLPAAERDKINKAVETAPEEYYMLCFCDKENLLGQWRGYAFSSGVNIGFDFNHGYTKELSGCWDKCYSIFSVLDANDSTMYTDDLRFVEAPIQVQYTKDKRLSKNLKKVFSEIYTGNDEDALTHIVDYSPYIKDELFDEEREYRIIFDLGGIDLSEGERRLLRRKKLCFRDIENIKQPYIKVAVGLKEKKEKDVDSVYIGTDTSAFGPEISTYLRDHLLNGVITVYNDVRKDIFVSEGRNQEEVVKCIETVLEGRYDLSKLKIWCEGHLPIREIRIGPGKQSKEMKESIEHYINTIYWLRYVDVIEMDSPYRG